MAYSFQDRFHNDISLDFADVLIEPQALHAAGKPPVLHSCFSSTIALSLPFLVTAENTDAATAIAMARMGSIGILPNTLSIGKQADLVRQVKRFQTRIVRDVIMVTPETSIIEAMEYAQRYTIRLMPVVEAGTQVLAGFIEIDPDMTYDAEQTVSVYMSQKPFATITNDMDIQDAYTLMNEQQADFIAITDNAGRCVGLVTAEDKEKIDSTPNATMDENGALRVAARVGTEAKEYDRVHALMDAGVDAIVIYDERGHSKAMLDMITHIRRQRSVHVEVIAGNIQTEQAALAAMDAGANGLMIGHSHALAELGIGVGRLTGLMGVAQAAAMQDIPVMAHFDLAVADRVKAFAAGAASVIVTSQEDAQNGAEPLRKAITATDCASLEEFSERTRFIRLKKD